MPGDTRAFALLNCAHVLKTLKKYTDAEPMMRRALAVLEGSFGGNHPKTATGYSNLALLLIATDRQIEALPLLRQAHHILSETLGPEHPTYATVVNNLSCLLQEYGTPEESDALMREALAGAVKLQVRNGFPSPSLERRIRNYRALRQQLGDTPEQARQKLDEILQPIGGL